jgi:N-methylhydantoinase A
MTETLSERPETGGYRLAVDIGGTFTDAVCVAADGTTMSAKALTIPGQQDTSVAEAVVRMGVPLAEVDDFIHGTTTALNALLERRGARLAMLVTSGFRDVYEIGRASRPEMYNIKYHRPDMLLRRRDIFEVAERMSVEGDVLIALDEDEIRSIAARLAGNYDAIAVCFLHAYRHGVHEARVKEILLEQLPGTSVVTSGEVAPEWREYERFSTALVSAYVTPKISDYLGRLEERLSEGGLRTPLHVMQSNGGVMTAQMGVRKAAQTLFSGPVGGTVACVAIGRELGAARLICVDMGGTSFDVSLVVDGGADIENELEIQGHPVLTPSVSMYSLGAGGGSIVYAQAGGLRVGPESAGAIPGPACYGRGGLRPTITDANLFLGRIPRDARLGGTLELDYEASATALAAVAEELEMDVDSLAAGTIAVADAMMADAIRELTVARGIDPRDFDLVAFGGAGPLHAVALAEELDIKRVIIPFGPGVLSAWGMLQADIRHDLVRSYFTTLGDAQPALIAAQLDVVGEQARDLLAAEGVATDRMVLEAAADLRYAGQEYTLTIAMNSTADAAALQELEKAFHAAYHERYGHNNPTEQVEMVNLRVTALGVRPHPSSAAISGASVAPVAARDARTVFAGDTHETPIYMRDEFGSGAQVSGPAIVLETGCTTLIPPGWQAVTSDRGHLVLTRHSGGASR